MKNKEKYYEEIINSLTVTNGHCNFKREYVMKLSYCSCGCKECHEKTRQWLEAEYIEPIRLKMNEKTILESLAKEIEWIARNKSGDLYIYCAKPSKFESVWSNALWSYLFDFFNHLFQFIKWEDAEPYSIEDLLKCEVVDDE